MQQRYARVQMMSYVDDDDDLKADLQKAAGGLVETSIPRARGPDGRFGY